MDQFTITGGLVLYILNHLVAFANQGIIHLQQASDPVLITVHKLTPVQTHGQECMHGSRIINSPQIKGFGSHSVVTMDV